MGIQLGQAGQADLDAGDVQRRPSSPSSPQHSAVLHNTRHLQQQQRSPIAIQQQHSSLRAGSELTAKKGSFKLLLWMSKICSLTETDLKLNPESRIHSRLMNSTMISYVNSFFGIQP